MEEITEKDVDALEARVAELERYLGINELTENGALSLDEVEKIDIKT